MNRPAHKFLMRVQESFQLGDGRRVLAGEVEGGEQVLILPGQCDVLINGRKKATITIEPEMLFTPGDVWTRRDFRAVATRDKIDIEDSEIKSGLVTLEGLMSIHGHRDLIGIESPPLDFSPDPMTLGPRLPDGWDGDAWVGPNEADYFLRAWNKSTARYAIARASKYEEARDRLLDEIRHHPRRVTIQMTESGAK